MRNLRSKKFRIENRPSVVPETLEIRKVEGKGEGVFCSSIIERGDFVCEYIGELLSSTKREKFPPEIDKYTPEGNFSLFFQTMDGKTHCIDAMNSTGPGRKINHVTKGGNLKPVVMESTMQKPRIFFKALRNIYPGEELLYPYGELDKEAIENFPFLG